MTDKGANSWFLPYWKHLMQPECEEVAEWGGIVCDGTVEVRRIAFHSMPSNFFGMKMKILQLERADESSKSSDGSLEGYLEDEGNYSVVPFKEK